MPEEYQTMPDTQTNKTDFNPIHGLKPNPITKQTKRDRLLAKVTKMIIRKRKFKELHDYD